MQQVQCPADGVKFRWQSVPKSWTGDSEVPISEYIYNFIHHKVAKTVTKYTTMDIRNKITVKI